MKKELVKASLNKNYHGKKAASVADDYVLQSLFATMHPENYLEVFSYYLRAFYTETDPPTKYALLPLIKRSLFQFQRAYPESEIGSLLEAIMLSGNCPDSFHSLEMVKIGLNVVAHDRRQEIDADAYDYFNWSVNLLAHHFRNAKDTQNLQKLISVLPELKITILQRPKLATSEYFELCVDFINIVPLREPRTDLDRKYKQPHEIKRSERIAEENTIINDAHSYGIDGIFTLLKIFAERMDNIDATRLPHRPETKELERDIRYLFSHAGIKKLDSKPIPEMNEENRGFFQHIVHAINALTVYKGPSIFDTNYRLLPRPIHKPD